MRMPLSFITVLYIVYRLPLLCKFGCPVHIDIPEHINAEKFVRSWQYL